MGKGSFKYAWVMDKLQAERERGITIASSLNEMWTQNRKITIIDAPGHRDFIKNMISGTSQADFAILMIAAGIGEFESGISGEGQTCEHALLAQTLGIKNFIICINKMDLVGFKQDRYEEITNYMTQFMTNKLGYKPENFKFVPISGFHGDNVVDRSERCPWYTGKTLAELIDALPVPKRPLTKPLRFPITSFFKIAGIGTVITGRVETGVVKPGMKTLVVPGKFEVEIKSLEEHHEQLAQAEPGQNIGVSFKSKSLTHNLLHRGMVLGEMANEPPRQCKSFTARIVVVNHAGELRPGYSPVLHIHAATVTCKMISFANSFNRRNGKALEAEPKVLKKDQGATVKFEPMQPLVLEPFKKFSQLGRGCLRDSKVTVAVCIIESVEYVD